ncbi:hypothetical protein HX744_26585 [Pseudonocardia sp. ICBG1122]|nr:hypothetical protein [Pseudonocardia pini]
MIETIRRSGVGSCAWVVVNGFGGVRVRQILHDDTGNVYLFNPETGERDETVIANHDDTISGLLWNPQGEPLALRGDALTGADISDLWNPAEPFWS